MVKIVNDNDDDNDDDDDDEDCCSEGKSLDSLCMIIKVLSPIRKVLPIVSLRFFKLGFP